MKLKIKEIIIFAMLGSFMYASKVIMEPLPNIHLLGVLTVAFTAVYRKKALYIIYTYVFIFGLISGFSPWWVPQLYLWTVLWGATMLLPKRLPRKICPIAYMLVCAAHGFLYGTLYAPAQSLLFGLDFDGMLTWIVAGLPFDLIHGVSNLIGGLLICPIVLLLRNIDKYVK